MRLSVFLPLSTSGSDSFLLLLVSCISPFVSSISHVYILQRLNLVTPPLFFSCYCFHSVSVGERVRGAKMHRVQTVVLLWFLNHPTGFISAFVARWANSLERLCCDFSVPASATTWSQDERCWNAERWWNFVSHISWLGPSCMRKSNPLKRGLVLIPLYDF